MINGSGANQRHKRATHGKDADNSRAIQHNHILHFTHMWLLNISFQNYGNYLPLSQLPLEKKFAWFWGLDSSKSLEKSSSCLADISKNTTVTPPMNFIVEILSVCAGWRLFASICVCPGWCSLSLKRRPASPHKYITLPANTKTRNDVSI